MLAVAEHLDTVNLPADRGHIEKILDRSERAFAGTDPVFEREFLFVLEDLSKQRIIGTSIIYAQHGTRRAPHVFYRVEIDERYSVSLDKHFAHSTLRIGYNYHGPTEIGGLILLPEYRRNTEALGKALSYVRFLFIAMHRDGFRDHVLSELLPPLQTDGTSKLWEALGRKFTGLSYQDADLLSKDNKEFIHALFPDDPIHTVLLPDDVRSIIGQVGRETQPVERMLRRIGFDYANQIDPFDGGPHFVAATDSITLVKSARQIAVTSVDHADGERPWAVLAVETPGAKPGFRAIGARVIPMGDQVVGITDDARRRLGADNGQRVWMCSEDR
ncbi:MAG TPA: arginine N-succinyltransferase [Kofleriaceae bacterium]